MDGKKEKNCDGTESLKWAVIAKANYWRDPNSGRIQNGKRDVLCDFFGVSKTTLNDYLHEWDAQHQIVVVPDLSSKRPGVCGVGNLLLTEELIDCIFELSDVMGGDFTYEHFTKRFNEHYEVDPPIHVSTMYRWFQRLEVVETTSHIKPKLSERHKLRRLNFVLQKLEPAHDMFRIKDQSRHLHLDEKWFYAMRTSRKLKLLPGQGYLPQTTCHKSHITKVMFISVVGMPQQLPDGSWWDGKIGLFPVVNVTQAKWNSKNRPAGADVVKNVSLDAGVYHEMLTKEGGILDTIRQKMSWAKDDNIVIQHDGAPGHMGGQNIVLLPAAGLNDGWKITFETQPAQSPDLNINDLCFFNSLQKRSFELRSQSKTEVELIQTVQEAWERYDSETLERAWALQFEVYRNVLDHKGDNQFDTSHSDTRKRQREEAGTIDSFVSMHTYLTGIEARDELLN